MTPSGSRSPVAVLLPAAEAGPVASELAKGGFDPILLEDARDLGDLLAKRSDLVAAVLDADSDPEDASAAWALLHRGGRAVPSLMIVDAATLDRFDMSAPGHETDEYSTRPYSAESIRWRVEAMCIRSVALDDGSGPVLQTTLESGDWGRRGALVAVFNPKGGVGKTMVATNLAASLNAEGQRVLLIDADTVTGHVPTSLGMEGVPTVVDAWRDELEGGPSQTFSEIASAHSSGMRVLQLSDSPIHTEILNPARVATSIVASCRGFDFVIADLHPSYSPLNRAVFDKADRILVPVTPDLPAIRAMVKLREVADELGMRDRLAMIINRANSGVPVADVERAVGIPCYAQIRSSGPTMVRALNEGRTLVEFAPKDAITGDFAVLADRLLGRETANTAKPAFRLFGRTAGARA
jgi:MinD-like ATPase involved in chromosome partitioning or flagellar assembly